VSLHASAKTHSTVLEARNLASLECSMGAVVSGHTSFRREVVEFLGTLFDKNLNHKPQWGFTQKVVEHGSTMLFEHMIAVLNFWNMLMHTHTIVHMDLHCPFNGIHCSFKFQIAFGASNLETGIVVHATNLVQCPVV